MEKMSPQSQRSPSVVPLARDPDGNPIELPDGAVGWRIRRQTGGRPRLLLDGKKQPMAFPLHYTIADVEDILAPGSYLLDVVDKGGEPLGVTIAVSLGMARNAEAVEPDNENNVPAVVPTTLPSTTSEVRLVLEANVRSTQMAFSHNQRTLELALRMAETLRDGVQVLATAQADWIKSVSSARGFFRATAQPLPPVEVKQLTVRTGGGEDENDDDDDDDDDREEAASSAEASSHWSAPLMPIVQSVVQQVGPAVLAWAAKQQAGGGRRKGDDDSGGRREERLPPGEARDFLSLRPTEGAAQRVDQAAEPARDDEPVARDAASAEHKRKLAAAIEASWSPVLGLDIPQLVRMLPKATVSKVMAVQAALTADERADAMQVLGRQDGEGLAELLGVFDVATLEVSSDFLRRLIGDLRAANAARAKPPTNGGGGGPTEPRG